MAVRARASAGGIVGSSDFFNGLLKHQRWAPFPAPFAARSRPWKKPVTGLDETAAGGAAFVAGGAAGGQLEPLAARLASGPRARRRRVPLVERLNATAQLNVDWERRPSPGRVSTDSTLLLGVDYFF